MRTLARKGFRRDVGGFPLHHSPGERKRQGRRRRRRGEQVGQKALAEAMLMCRGERRQGRSVWEGLRKLNQNMLIWRRKPACVQPRPLQAAHYETLLFCTSGPKSIRNPRQGPRIPVRPTQFKTQVQVTRHCSFCGCTGIPHQDQGSASARARRQAAGKSLLAGSVTLKPLKVDRLVEMVEELRQTGQAWLLAARSVHSIQDGQVSPTPSTERHRPMCHETTTYITQHITKH